MPRRLMCLSLIALTAGCTVGTDSSPRNSVTPADEAVADGSKRLEVLPPPVGDPNEEMEELARTDPVAFVTKVVERYDREVTGYRCTLQKQERVKGKLHPAEVVECCFREKPFSVRMDWKQGAKLADKTAYVEGRNKGNVLVLGAGFRRLVGVIQRAPDGADARASSRYPITDFGIQIGTRRVLEAFLAAKKRGDLQVEFNGVKRLDELNGRPAWELKRVGYLKPEKDGITGETFYFDLENWLQIGSVLTGENGLIAAYYFRDVELNPDFAEDTFTRAGLTK